MALATVTGSDTVTPKSKLAVKRLAPADDGKLRNMPMAASRGASPNIIRSMSLLRAPSAIRMPISCVRLPTMKAIAPYKPMAANVARRLQLPNDVASQEASSPADQDTHMFALAI